MSRKLIALVSATLLGVVYVAGCEGPEGDMGPQGPAGPFLRVQPSTATIRVGDTAQFAVTTSDRQETYTWSSNDPSVATVDNAGVVTGVGEGVTFLNVVGDESNASEDVIVAVDPALASEISFSQHILPMFTSSNFWYDGAEACTSCHFEVSDESAHQIDLSSWAGLMTGAESLEEPPGESLLGESAPGAGDFDWGDSELRERMRNNRMPPGWVFFRNGANRNGPDLMEDPNNPGHLIPVRFVYTSWKNEDNVPNALGLLQAWVEAGAPNNPSTFDYIKPGFSFTGLDFDTDVLPFFTQNNMYFEDSEACTGCHFSNSPNSSHEMDLSSYNGIRSGAEVASEPPGESILGESAPFAGDFDWDGSELRHRLRDNRMPPPGWPFFIDQSNRNGPVITHPVLGLPVRALDLIGEWVAAGAPDN